MFYFSISMLSSISQVLKRVLVFVSDEHKVALRLNKLRKWLLNWCYPESVIDKSLSNAKLQGTANEPANFKTILPFGIYILFKLIYMQNVVKSINQKLKPSPNESTKETFGETQTVLSLK